MGNKDDITLRLRITQLQEFLRDVASGKRGIDEVTTSARKLGVAAKETGGGHSSHLGLMSTTLGQLRYAAAGAILGIGAGTAAIVKMGISATATLEQVQTGFTNMLKSKDAAKSLVKDLQVFSDWSPFEDKDVYKWGQSLVGLGAKAQQVVPMLTALGDAAAAMGQGPEEVSGSLTAIEQIAAKGRLQGDELLQLQEHMVFARDILEQGFNLHGKAFDDAMQKGQLSSSVVIPMILKGLETKYKGNLVAQSQTMSGLWSTIKSGFMRAITADPDSPFAVALRGWLKKVADDMPNIQARIRTVLSKLWDLAKGAKAFYDWLKQIGQSSGAQRILHDIGDAIHWIFNDISVWPMIGQLGGWLFSSEGQSAIVTALDQIANFIENSDVQFFLKSLATYTVGMWAFNAATAASALSMERLKTAALFFTKSRGLLVALAALVGGRVAYDHSATVREQTDIFNRGFPGAMTKWKQDPFGVTWKAIAYGAKNTAIQVWHLLDWMAASTAKFFHDLFTSMWNGIDTWVTDKWHGLYDWIHNTMIPGIGSAFASMWQGVISWFRKALQDALTFSIGGYSFGPNLGATPGAARGGDVVDGGLVSVGEAGKEILSLPRGAKVIPQQRTAMSSMAMAGGGTYEHTHPIEMDGRLVTKITHRHSDTEMARR